MKYIYLGGAREVGASCLLVKVDNRNILFDCGVRVNQTRDASLPNLDLLKQHAQTLDAIFISHAHADHVGALPLVHQMYPKTPIFATTPTAHAATVMLTNAVNLTLADALSQKEDVLTFTKEMVLNALNSIYTINPDPNEWIDIGWEDNWAFRFIPAGHILGAVSIVLRTPQGTYLYTGDVSAFNQRVVDGIGNKLADIKPDFMWCEATYGDRNHPARKSEEKKLAKDVEKVIQDGGNVLIPAFALGRAQEITCILITAMQSSIIEAFPVMTDGLVNKINKVYEQNIQYASKRFQHFAHRIKHIFTTFGIRPIHPDERKQIIDMDMPKCVIASSGMLTGGASVDYAKKWATHPKNAIFLSGYQDEESPGGHLQTLAQNDELTFADKETVQAKCKVQRFHLSAHSDQGQLIEMIKQAKPKAIALAHGEPTAIHILAEKLSKDFAVTIAEKDALYDTTHNPFMTSEYAHIVEQVNNPHLIA